MIHTSPKNHYDNLEDLHGFCAYNNLLFFNYQFVIFNIQKKQYSHNTFTVYIGKCTLDWSIFRLVLYKTNTISRYVHDWTWPWQTTTNPPPGKNDWFEGTKTGHTLQYSTIPNPLTCWKKKKKKSTASIFLASPPNVQWDAQVGRWKCHFSCRQPRACH